MMEAEKLTYASYKAWVEDTTKDLNFEITTATREIEQLAAFIEKADYDAHKLSVSIAKLKSEIESLTGEKAHVTSEREEQHTSFASEEEHYLESIDALERALDKLRKQENLEHSQAAALLQSMRKTVPGMPGVLAALMEAERDVGAPDVAAYEFQSGSIVDVLERLLTKFKREYDSLMKAETNEQHYYELEVMHLSDLITKYTKDMEAQQAAKAKSVEDSAKAGADKAAEEKSKADDEKFLSEMKSTFSAKSATFNANKEVRAAEFDALDKAITIISSPDVAESYKEHVKLAQVAPSSPASFLQMGSSTRGTSSRQRAAELLTSKSRVLASSE